MKRNILGILLFTLLYAVILSGCTLEQGTNRVETTALETTEAVPTTTVRQASWTEQDLLELFNGYTYADPDNKQAVDCAVVTDSAYELLGVVLYTADDYEGCSLDFINRDGVCVGRIGIGSFPAEDTQLEYLGDGGLSCQLLHTDGDGYLCKIFYTINEEGTYFRVEG